MTRVSIYDPFADVFPALFRSVLAPVSAERPAITGATEVAAPMRLDVSETAQGYVVRADLPGVPKDAIQIEIDGNRVTLRTRVQREPAKTDERVLRSERHTGDYARSLAFSEEIDDSRASAKVEHGVLELALPKKTGAGPTRLTVQ